MVEGGSPVKEPQKRSNLLSNRAEKRKCIIMVCKNDYEVDQVSGLLFQVNSATLITYRRLEDLILNRPTGEVVLFILADGDEVKMLEKMLEWSHSRWPYSSMVVIGDEGEGEMEIAARKGGAYYLTRPVSQWEWKALIQHPVRKRERKMMKNKSDGLKQ